MELDNLSYSITKALAYTENGGVPNISNPSAGKTGETKSIFQFLPATWKKYSTEVMGKEVPLTPDNETYVVNEKVSNWLKEGRTARQIASMWNAGESEPDAYKGNFSTGKASKNVNQQYGVSYDVPGYADKVLKYAQQFYQEKQQKQNVPGLGLSNLPNKGGQSTTSSLTQGYSPAPNLP